MIKQYLNDPSNPDTISHNQIYCIFEDRSGDIWFGTKGGINKFDKKNETFFHYKYNPADPDSLSYNTVFSITQDYTGKFWVGTFDGLNEFNPETHKFTIYKHNPKDPDSISNSRIFCTHEDKLDNLWIGTWGGGLNKFNKKNGKFIHYTENDGLCNNTVYAILEDKQGNLWISTANGLSRFNPFTEEFKNYYMEDGLSAYEFNLGGYFKDKTGKLYFGSVNGLIMFYPDELQANNIKPPIVLTDFQVKSQSITVRDNKYLEENSTMAKQITLSYRDNIFSFEFAALDYSAPNRNQYAYKLEGFNKEWIYTRNRRFAIYTNLVEGHYKLLMIAFIYCPKNIKKTDRLFSW